MGFSFSEVWIESACPVEAVIYCASSRSWCLCLRGGLYCAEFPENKKATAWVADKRKPAVGGLWELFLAGAVFVNYVGWPHLVFSPNFLRACLADERQSIWALATLPNGS